MVRQGDDARTLLIRLSACCLAVVLLTGNAASLLMAEQNTYPIDDRTSGDMTATAGNAWYFVADGVMGGVSDGRLTPGSVDNRPCLQLQGDVRLENNGGFIQAALVVPDEVLKVIGDYTGVSLEVMGNSERYNLHLRTSDLWRPWQSYRASFIADPRWRQIRIPFADFEAYRTDRHFRPDRLVRIGLVAIGREFQADLCLGDLRFYRNDGSEREG